MRATPMIATVLVLTAMHGAVAASAIPSSELPGRERERFVDPPGARLMQPTEPNVRFHWDAQPGNCNMHVTRTSRWKRLKRRGC